MGNVVSHVMRHHRGSTLARREIEDVLNRLSVLAEVKARNHHSRVTSHPIDAEILPIEKVVRKVHLAHCGVSSGNVKAVQDAIEEHFGYYMVGDVVEGLSAVLTETIDHLMNTLSSKNSSEFTSYAITIGNTGSIGRIDIYMFYYKFASPHVARMLSNCLITSLVVSMVEPSKLRLDDVRALAKAPYSSPLPGESEREVDERLERIENLLVQVTQTALGKALKRSASA